MLKITLKIVGIIVLLVGCTVTGTLHVPPGPPPPPYHRPGKGSHYYYNELGSPYGPHRCRSSKQCDGARTCSIHGWCQGSARPNVHPQPGPRPKPPRPAPPPPRHHHDYR